MIPWTRIVHLGDLAVMVPAAATIAALLITRHTWRMAIWWCVLFASGIGLVAFSKIAFLAWGTGIREIDFKALSGHATLTTAIMPVMFYLMLRHADASARVAGIVAGTACGVSMAVLLVWLKEHSAAEVVAGCVLGAVVSLAFLDRLRARQPLYLNWWAIPLGILFFLYIRYAEPVSPGVWLIRTALLLSGRNQLYSWTTWELDNRVDSYFGHQFW
jgi:hypothetical protein